MIIVFPPDATPTLRIGAKLRFATVSIGAAIVVVPGVPIAARVAAKVPTDDNHCQCTTPVSG
jgi:hypothetical protein